MEAFQLGAITAQFTLATLYVAPLQHLINTMRNRDSHLCSLAAERPSLNQAESGGTTVSDALQGNMLSVALSNLHAGMFLRKGSNNPQLQYF